MISIRIYKIYRIEERYKQDGQDIQDRRKKLVIVNVPVPELENFKNPQNVQISKVTCSLN